MTPRRSGVPPCALSREPNDRRCVVSLRSTDWDHSDFTSNLEPSGSFRPLHRVRLDYLQNRSGPVRPSVQIQAGPAARWVRCSVKHLRLGLWPYRSLSSKQLARTVDATRTRLQHSTCCVQRRRSDASSLSCCRLARDDDA